MKKKILSEQCKPGQVYIYIDEQYRSMGTEGTLLIILWA
jgi:hypothetical protein